MIPFDVALVATGVALVIGLAVAALVPDHVVADDPAVKDDWNLKVGK